MKTKILFIAILIAVPLVLSQAQGFQPPSAGKAVVYFTRLSAAGFAVGFDFYDHDKYIGGFAGRNYMRYETDPGKHLFWASSENYEFLTAELNAGGTYVVSVDVQMGFAIARVGLTPITSPGKALDRAKKLVDKKEPKQESDEELAASNASRAAQIQGILTKYEEKWKEKREYKHLAADMALPENLLSALP